MLRMLLVLLVVLKEGGRGRGRKGEREREKSEEEENKGGSRRSNVMYLASKLPCKLNIWGVSVSMHAGHVPLTVYVIYYAWTIALVGVSICITQTAPANYPNLVNEACHIIVVTPLQSAHVHNIDTIQNLPNRAHLSLGSDLYCFIPTSEMHTLYVPEVSLRLHCTSGSPTFTCN